MMKAIDDGTVDHLNFVCAKVLELIGGHHDRSSALLIGLGAGFMPNTLFDATHPFDPGLVIVSSSVTALAP